MGWRLASKEERGMDKKDSLHKLIDVVPEFSLDQLLCHLAAIVGGCPDNDTAPSSSSSSHLNPEVLITGAVVNDAFHFFTQLEGVGGKTKAPFILDTGAFEMLLMKDVADQLNLPNEGPIEIAGVTGSVQAYRSFVGVSAPGTDGVLVNYPNIPCVVDPTAAGNLFGFRFFLATNQVVAVNPISQQMGWFSHAVLLN